MEQIFKTRIVLYALAFFGLLLTSCSNDDDITLSIPSISEVEIGSANRGVIGRDIHFNVEVLAGDMIDLVQVNINPREEENYTHDWSFEIAWDEFKGVKNATVHKHFDVPEDAAEGKYDFIITVTDENGTKLEEIFEVEIIDPINLPVDPSVYLFAVEKIDIDGNTGLANFYANGDFRNPDDKVFRENESIVSYTQINNVKDDGILYNLLIKKSLNHKPETVDDIDFSKAIVIDVLEHTNYEEVTSISTYFNPDVSIRDRPALTIGALQDNNLPNPNSIDGDNVWESGTYYYGIVYTNTTHNLSVHHYIEFDIVF
ncbi:uncharacterized protein DUF4625 [Tenacibaculum adriaticum]|uniref:Uncharacterized protein DUF4625 n=1 Tax=Tenacibaculum adriaticum TaxID=413713 RepID=A0A5S5DWR5_9FLAO|nr:DUF4625 domain-containing protein [Tenacibaculum adriaticum]TYQ00175.1 uncharacterized protein DUF4625 [Tenacibaculum adriaticum]